MTFEAMQFARAMHRNQRRKYTGNPYADHLAEVAGIVAACGLGADAVAVAWLHDCVEDQGVSPDELAERFGPIVAGGVILLTDAPSTASRVERRAISNARLAGAPGWIQTIKCADIISNTASVKLHDPGFAPRYLAEKRETLEGLTQADRRLYAIALSQSQ